MIQWLYSYLHNEFGDTHYSYHARRILIDDFSALPHGGAMVVRTFVLCVLGCKSTLYVGTIQKNYFAPARQLEYSLSQTLSFFIAYAAYPTVVSKWRPQQASDWIPHPYWMYTMCFGTLICCLCIWVHPCSDTPLQVGLFVGRLL